MEFCRKKKGFWRAFWDQKQSDLNFQSMKARNMTEKD